MGDHGGGGAPRNSHPSPAGPDRGTCALRPGVRIAWARLGTSPASADWAPPRWRAGAGGLRAALLSARAAPAAAGPRGARGGSGAGRGGAGRGGCPCGVHGSNCRVRGEVRRADTRGCSDAPALARPAGRRRVRAREGGRPARPAQRKSRGCLGPSPAGHPHVPVGKHRDGAALEASRARAARRGVDEVEEQADLHPTRAARRGSLGYELERAHRAAVALRHQQRVGREKKRVWAIHRGCGSALAAARCWLCPCAGSGGLSVSLPHYLCNRAGRGSKQLAFSIATARLVHVD